MKKATAFLLTFLITLAVFIPTALAAPEFPDSDADAAAVMLVDVKSGNVLYSKNPDDKIYPASTTKIMTSLLAIEKGDMAATITAGKEISQGIGSGSSKLGLKSGEKIKMKDLIYGMMMVSGNDAANTIAVTIGGSLEKFADMMNAKAQELGMDGSHFVSAHGLQDEDHYSTANDMKKLTLYALQNSAWYKLFTTNQYDLPAHNVGGKPLDTTNKLASHRDEDAQFHYEYCIGGKTGLTTATNPHNGCLVTIAKKGDMQLLALIFGDPSSSSNGRFTIAKKLFEFGFNNYTSVDLKDTLSKITVSQKIDNASESDADKGMLELAPDIKDSMLCALPNDIKDEITSNVASITPTPDITRENLKAPVKKGEKFGTVTYKYKDDTILGTADLIATRDMAAVGQEDAFDSATPSLSPNAPVQQQQPKELFSNGGISPWWWLLLPAVLIAVIVIRVSTVNKRRRSRFRNKRKVYNYRIR